LFCDIHSTFGKVHKKFTVFHKRNITPEELSGLAEKLQSN